MVNIEHVLINLLRLHNKPCLIISTRKHTSYDSNSVKSNNLGVSCHWEDCPGLNGQNPSKLPNSMLHQPHECRDWRHSWTHNIFYLVCSGRPLRRGHHDSAQVHLSHVYDSAELLPTKLSWVGAPLVVINSDSEKINVCQKFSRNPKITIQLSPSFY